MMFLNAQLLPPNSHMKLNSLSPTSSNIQNVPFFPDAFDHELMISCLRDIQAGKPTKVPVYDFKTNARERDRFTEIFPSDVVLLEGILVFYHKDVREMFDMKLFVDTDADTRLARRGERGLQPLRVEL